MYHVKNKNCSQFQFHVSNSQKLENIYSTFRLLLLIVIPAFGADKELAKGVATITGSISFVAEFESYDLARTDLTLSPYAGYFVVDDIQILSGLRFQRYTYPKREGRSPTSRLDLSAGARYYFPIERLNLYFGSIVNLNKSSNSRSGVRSFNFQFGMIVLFKKNFGLDISLELEREIDYSAHTSLKIGAGTVYFIR